MKSKQFEDLIEYGERHIGEVVCVDRDGSRESTFGDWFVLARKVAAYLKANLKDINPEGEYLLLECPNGLEFEAAELGAWMVGCAIVPLGIGFPEDRKQFIKAHCESRFSFTPEVFKDIYECEPINECIIPEDNQPALLLYTSGSTGVPKGVMHRISSLATLYKNSNYDNLLDGMRSMLLGFPSYVIMGACVFIGTSVRGLVNHFLDANRIADPQYIMKCDTMPLKGNGKVDIQKLPGQSILWRRETKKKRSYYDYLLKEHTNSNHKEESDKWFGKLLKDKQNIDLPYSDNTAVNTHGHNSMKISAELSINEDIAEICKRAGVTESTYFVYRMLMAMQGMLNIDNGILWINSNGRVAANLENAVGMFLKLIPVVMPDGYKQMTLNETLKQLQTQMLTSMCYESLYFKGLDFIYQGDMYLRIMNECSRLADDMVRLDSDPSMDPLVIEIEKDFDGTYSCNVLYDLALYNDSTVDRLLENCV